MKKKIESLASYRQMQQVPYHCAKKLKYSDSKNSMEFRTQSLSTRQNWKYNQDRSTHYRNQPVYRHNTHNKPFCRAQPTAKIWRRLGPTAKPSLPWAFRRAHDKQLCHVWTRAHGEVCHFTAPVDVVQSSLPYALLSPHGKVIGFTVCRHCGTWQSNGHFAVCWLCGTRQSAASAQ